MDMLGSVLEKRSFFFALGVEGDLALVKPGDCEILGGEASIGVVSLRRPNFRPEYRKVFLGRGLIDQEYRMGVGLPPRLRYARLRLL
jgi:hypothetical protein